ncbi:MAG: amino acid permease [Gammaproteobacteria bacterium]|nr:amino acid permease [Gammaproteobacteria bacterium]
MLTALVAGNMIGSGVFLLPASLASIGSISLFSWVLTAIGAFALAIVFARMSLVIPKSGGPYAYAQAGFGDFIGFQTAYNYWIAIWVGNAAIAIAMVGYLAVFFPTFHNPVIGCWVAIIAIWLLTIVNIIGVRSAGLMALVTTILKLVPILLIGIFGWWYFHPEYLTNSFNISHHSNFSAVSYAATLTLWAFIGVESATVPAGNVDNPRRNIPLATLLGTLIAAVAYIASSTAIMGMIPADVLAQSTSPFAAAAAIIFGHWGSWLIAAGAAISCFGCLNGWVLLQGQVPMAAADDKLFPQIFAKRNRAGVPAWGLIITAILITALLFFTISPNLIKQFEIIILIAALTSLIPYLYTAIASIITMRQNPKITKSDIFQIIVALIAGLYAFWAMFGSGKEIIFYGSMLVFLSVPLYGWVIWQKEGAL